MLNRRTLLLGATLALAGDRARGTAVAAGYPDRPVRIIVPFAAGGTPDIVPRIVAQKLSTILRQAVIVDNRPGAGGTIGSKAAAASEPDGYTLLLGSTSTLAITPAMNPDGSDPLRTFAPVAMMAGGWWILVVDSSLPVHSVAELIAYARQHPGRMNVGFSNGSPPHIMAELFKALTQTDITSVPYRGGALAIADLLKGQIQLTIDTPSVLAAFIEQKKLRPLAVTSKDRDQKLPHVPTFGELGMTAFPHGLVFGILAPRETPAEIVAVLNRAVNEALGSEDVTTALAKLGFEPRSGTPEEYSALIAEEALKWAEIVKLAGVRAQ